MTKEQYAEKRRDPRWQRMRLEIMGRDNWGCLRCGEKSKPLNVHHNYYIPGRDPWEYPLWSLQTLCEDCHQEVGNLGHFFEWEEMMEKLCGGRPTQWMPCGPSETWDNISSAICFLSHHGKGMPFGGFDFVELFRRAERELNEEMTRSTKELLRKEKEQEEAA